MLAPYVDLGASFILLCAALGEPMGKGHPTVWSYCFLCLFFGERVVNSQRVKRIGVSKSGWLVWFLTFALASSVLLIQSILQVVSLFFQDLTWPASRSTLDVLKVFGFESLSGGLYAVVYVPLLAILLVSAAQLYRFRRQQVLLQGFDVIPPAEELQFPQVGERAIVLCVAFASLAAIAVPSFVGLPYFISLIACLLWFAMCYQKPQSPSLPDGASAEPPLVALAPVWLLRGALLYTALHIVTIYSWQAGFGAGTDLP
ncbi:hypothetical protein CYMTET_29737 [Cymbomonas tetramitiformis]|uniref:Uncharacterized protein n=1 Tax=Cymbomonas tetramitiformis TaxID=36881 RepID=A0AAE0KUV8_9CHLO|nr:hypothetical protein CYMTET_29737 [Cymbomonas tetramitiformis]